MELSQIKEGLVSALTEIQVQSGRPTPKITDKTRPMVDLPDFDSLNAVETTFILSDYFGCEITSDLILSTSTGKPLTISETADLLYDLVNKNEGAPHEKGYA